MNELNEKMDERFEKVLKVEEIFQSTREKKSSYYVKKPFLSIVILSTIILGCIFYKYIINCDPTYMNLANCNVSPNKEFWFGTDTMGRDIFSMIWYGGRISLFIGILATVISTIIAIIYGTISGLASVWIDDIMMRVTEIFLSIPSILTVIFIQAIIGKESVVAISFSIGITSWMSIAKVVRTEVKQLKSEEYVILSQYMSASFGHILKKHLAPAFVSAIMFMVVMNIRSAIVSEATLSFLGIGLPIEIISWGSMLSLSEKALLTNSWWIILIPGLFLVTTILCIANIGDYIRKEVNIKDSNL